MKIIKTNLTAVLIALFMALGLNSCSDDSDDNDPNNNATLFIRANAQFSGSTSRNNDLTISTFKMNIEEIELEFDDDNDDGDDNNDYGDYDDDGYVNSDDDIELEGPFEVDLLNGTTTLTSIELPQADYEELEFEFDESEDSNSELFNKTVLIEGTINGTPFEFWYDFEEEIELDYEDSTQDIDINAGLNEIIISFNVDDLFNETNGIDLSQATDDNSDGLIEINPNDSDGNNSLANAIKNTLKENFELLDD